MRGSGTDSSILDSYSGLCIRPCRLRISLAYARTVRIQKCWTNQVMLRLGEISFSCCQLVSVRHNNIKFLYTYIDVWNWYGSSLPWLHMSLSTVPIQTSQVLQGWLKIDCDPGKLSACIACPWGCYYCITMTSPFHPPLNP